MTSKIMIIILILGAFAVGTAQERSPIMITPPATNPRNMGQLPKSPLGRRFESGRLLIAMRIQPLINKPMTTPAPSCQKALPEIVNKMFRGCAPTARRIPISRVRRSTENDRRAYNPAIPRNAAAPVKPPSRRTLI